MRVEGKLKGLLGQFDPAFSTYLGILELRLYSGHFALQAGFLPRVLIIVYHIPQTHLGQVIELFLGIVQDLLLYLVYLGPFVYFCVAIFGKHAQCPVLELGHYGEPVDFNFYMVVNLVYVRVVPLGASFLVLSGTYAVVENIAV